MQRDNMQSGWPIIVALAALLAGGLACWLVVSNATPDHFWHDHLIAICAAAGFIVFCIFAELVRLKCPICRSRAILRISSKEIDRWLGQKTVTENSYTLGAFQARNSTPAQTKTRGLHESITATTRVIPVTKRRMLHGYRCSNCEYEFSRETVEEMR